MQVKILTQRKWGQPKITKPKELSKVPYITFKLYRSKSGCTFKVFTKDNDLYIYWADFFSSDYEPYKDDPKHGENNAWIAKCFNEQFGTSVVLRDRDFLYSDAWSGIVLRNEAYTKCEGFFDFIEQYKYDFITCKNLFLREHEKVFEFEEYTLENTAYSLWGNLLVEILGYFYKISLDK